MEGREGRERKEGGGEGGREMGGRKRDGRKEERREGAREGGLEGRKVYRIINDSSCIFELQAEVHSTDIQKSTLCTNSSTTVPAQHNISTS